MNLEQKHPKTILYIELLLCRLSVEQSACQPSCPPKSKLTPQQLESPSQDGPVTTEAVEPVRITAMCTHDTFQAIADAARKSAANELSAGMYVGSDLRRQQSSAAIGGSEVRRQQSAAAMNVGSNRLQRCASAALCTSRTASLPARTGIGLIHVMDALPWCATCVCKT